MHVWLLLLICLLRAGPAGAGAFSEEKRTGFVATTGFYRWDGFGAMQEAGLYAAYGLTPRLTLGFDAYYTPGLSSHALLFLRLPIAQGRGANRFAAEFGLGVHREAGGGGAMYRLSLAHGRSWDRGWYDLTASVERRSGQPKAGWKLDGTLGGLGKARLQPMLQLGLGRTGWGLREWRASAHLRYDTPKGATWVLGLERKHSGTTSSAVSLALWRRF